MICKREAFALITVLVVSSALMLFTLACWQRAMLCSDLVALREQYQERFYVAEAALDAGVQLVRQNPSWLTSQQIQERLPIESDVTNHVFSQEKLQTQHITAAIIISVPGARVGAKSKKRDKKGEQNFVCISAQLRESGKVVMVLRCTVTAYKRENNGTNDIQKNTQISDFPIVVDNFTIGSSV